MSLADIVEEKRHHAPSFQGYGEPSVMSLTKGGNGGGGNSILGSDQVQAQMGFMSTQNETVALQVPSDFCIFCAASDAERARACSEISRNGSRKLESQ